MSNKNKNRNNRLTPQDKPKPAGNQDYDLTQSFNKVRPYSRHTKKNNEGQGTHSDEDQVYQRSRGCISSNSSVFENTTTGAPNWDRYDRLEDRITSFSDKNEKDHTALRLELEGKIEKSSEIIRDNLKEINNRIDKKLSKQWYTWTVVAIVAIVGLIWLLSYHEVSKIPAEMIKIENRLEKVENDNNEQTQPDDSAKQINRDMNVSQHNTRNQSQQ